MTNFDARLAAHFRALDAAIPAPAGPDAAAGRAVLASAKSYRGRQLATRRGIVLVAAATVLLVGASVVSGQRVLFPHREEPELEAALVRIEAARGCLTLKTAEAEVPAILASLRYKDWTIRRLEGADSSRCVSFAIISEEHSVLILPGIGSSAATLLDSLRGELMAKCLGRDEAVALVRTALAGIGRDDIQIRAGSDLAVALPADAAAAWKQHVAQGCYVLSGGTTGDSSGRTTIYLWGK
jgi:hypothetical protein